ncbi:MAG: deoxyribodipyrimidine photo-lyase [Anaerolineaceae bacterium]|nr:deoxyribodipyrimidine photo-lyase [Anaerolineaceae bacterium]
MSVVIWWIRRIIRLDDNPVLKAALERGLPVLPVYIFDPDLFKVDMRRTDFLLRAVRGLDEELHAIGSALLTMYASIEDVFNLLSAQLNIVQIVTEQEVTLLGKTYEKKLVSIAPLKTIQAVTVYNPDQVRKPDGSPYRKYTAYRNTWIKLDLPDEVSYQLSGKFLPNTPAITMPFPSFPPVKGVIDSFSSKNAQNILDSFLSGAIKDYENLRNRIDLDDTSHCSHLFRFGLLSPRKTVKCVQNLLLENNNPKECSGYQTWLNELIWREFFNHLMDSYKSSEERFANKDGSNVQWRESRSELNAWQDGMTGYPLIDAAMRQLRQTGWMPNRARMVVASFLVKDLFLWWHHGERWFMKHLADGDPAANHGNWQWAAGIGTDAAPFFRIFNPITQSKKYDPQANYIRSWLPELAKVKTVSIHEPWKMDIQEQIHTHCRIGKAYPAPLVMHETARIRALELFRKRDRGRRDD